MQGRRIAAPAAVSKELQNGNLPCSGGARAAIAFLKHRQTDGGAGAAAAFPGHTVHLYG